MRAAGRRHRGVWLPPGGLVQRGCTPHFLFGLARKENGPCTVQKKRALSALRCSGPPRATGVGVSVPAPIWPDLRARLGLLRFPRLPSRGGWCPGRRGARTHLTCSSFRAFRFATRCPGGRRRCCVVLCCIFHQQPASGSENRRSMYPKLPRAGGLPKGSAFPSLTAARDSQPSPAGGRRSARAQTDPPNIFSFPPGAAHFLFGVSMRGPRRAPHGGERRSKGAGAVFAAGGNGA